MPAGRHILGLSAFYHDSSACVVRDGGIVAAAQEERFTRKKYDAAFPAHAVAYCLREAGLTVDDLDLVVFYENPALKFNRIVDTFVHAPRADPSDLERVVTSWATRQLWQRELIREALKYEGEVLVPLHHQSHASSAFFPSPFRSAAIVTMDGVGEWMTTTVGRGEEDSIALLKCVEFPHSLGLLYSAFTWFLGFRVNSGEHKLMGLAPYGTPKHVRTIRDRLIDIRDDGSFRLNMDFFDYATGRTMVNERFGEAFGRRPRRPEDDITQDDMDLARSIQDVTEEVVLKIVHFARQLTGERSLCLAGGVALNCVANARVLRQGGFEHVWIQPAAGDAGGALGAALFGWHQYLGAGREVDGHHDGQRGSLLGPQFDDEDIATALRSFGAVFQTMPERELIAATVDRLVNGSVVGHFNGRMEFGPRALGNRSILGDPRSPEMQRLMNLKIKFRESFRPFAPAVLEESAANFFDLPTSSPYMLLTAPVSEAVRLELTSEDRQRRGLDQLSVQRSRIPAVTHVDWSARVQTVSGHENPRFYELIRGFGERTGYPVLINTSFNVRGEPIVCSPVDAYACFMNTGMDCLVIGNCLLDKRAQPEPGDTIRGRRFDPD